MPARTGMYVHVDVLGENLVSRKFLRMGLSLESAEVLYEAIGEYIINVEEKQFATEGSFSGGWTPLSANTIVAKARSNFDPRILHATLSLVNSLTIRGDENMIFEATPEFLRFGSDVKYAEFHQRGTLNMPRRKVIDFTTWQRQTITLMIQRWVMGAWETPHAALSVNSPRPRNSLGQFMRRV